MRRPTIFTLAAILAGCSASRDSPGPRPLPPDDPVASPRVEGLAVDSPACVPEGVEFPASQGAGAVFAASAACCEGLQRAPIYKGSIIRLDECELAPGPRFFCVRCGNGRCGLGETACNCPADCHL